MSIESNWSKLYNSHKSVIISMVNIVQTHISDNISNGQYCTTQIKEEIFAPAAKEPPVKMNKYIIRVPWENFQLAGDVPTNLN